MLQPCRHFNWRRRREAWLLPVPRFQETADSTSGKTRPGWQPQRRRVAMTAAPGNALVASRLHHPIAGILPMLNEGQLEELAADIAQHGLHDPITRYQGMILDGRAREEGCRRANVDPRYEIFEGS